MGLLFVAFFALLLVSATATLWAMDTQKQDAQVINLAGRQRMLVRQMTSDALRVERDGDKAALQSLMEAADTFERTLAAFFLGGTTTYPPGRTVAIPAVGDAGTLVALQQVQATWTTFRGHLDLLAVAVSDSSERAIAIHAVEDLAPSLMQQADEVVRQYEAAARHKLARLRWIQLAFLAGSLALLALDLLLVHKLVVRPLQRLGSAAERIGGGDLSTPIEPAGPREIERLARSLDQMRAQLQAWTEELETRVARRTRELAALQEVSREITSKLEIRLVLQSVTDKARTLLAADVAVLCLLEPNECYLQSSASSGPAEAVLGGRISALHQLTERVLSSEGALPCGAGECQGCCGILAAPFRQSHLVAPLRIGAQVIGSLCVGGAATGQFPGEAVHVLTELANSAAIALENARLYEQAERLAALEERQRIAADMHDGLAQMISYLGLQVDKAADLVAAGEHAPAAGLLGYLRGAIEKASAEVRRAITTLQEDSPPPQALQERLVRLVAGLTPEGVPSVDLALMPEEPLLLSHDVCAEVQHVVGEALLNARRHARAQRIDVCLEQRGHEAVVVVTDDGRGFDPTRSPSDGRQHFGLSIMRARAARLGGSLAVQSAPGRGTQVTLTWPLEEE
jgi:two-component system nitrate/nitrite sensor histidine kinase NarX